MDQNCSSYDFIKGEILLVDKPISWTSFDVVNKIRWKLRHKLVVKKIKVGHGGTLDPMASGLMIIATGKKTKSLTQITGLDKVYEGQLELGASTPSYDSESDIDQRYPIDHINVKAICENVHNFAGKINQYPPIFSAVRIGGKKAYTLARKGKTPKMKSRKIEIFKFQISKIAMPYVDFKVHCSKGTYIRSLAHDFGQSLGSGAYLTKLKRTEIGSYQLGDAWDLDKLIECIDLLPERKKDVL